MADAAEPLAATARKKPHAPYIMPDGKPLSYYLLAERTGIAAGSKRRSQHAVRAKDELWAQLQAAKRSSATGASGASAAATAAADHDLAELRALERVGHRRRRRWLNERVLRDMAGSMTAVDMEACFKPVPFGVQAPPSAFARVAGGSGEAGALWEHFRSIDINKEAKVLEKWAAHNDEQRQQKQQQRQQQQPQPPEPDPAAAALAAWAGVGRAARTALKKANPHSVLELEMQVLELLEKAPGEELLLQVPDGFGRLLLHGLAEFHGLQSSTRTLAGTVYVAVKRKPLPSGAAAAPAPACEGADEGARGGEAAGVEVTCTDVLMGLRELGASGFGQRELGRYMRHHVHGVASDDLCSDDYVIV